MAMKIQAKVVMSEPEDGCSQMIPPPEEAENSTMKWFALVKRFPCPFSRKVQNAREAGYDGIIVYNIETVTKRNLSVAHFPAFNKFTNDGKSF